MKHSIIKQYLDFLPWLKATEEKLLKLYMLLNLERH